jgi:hypothetical protein
MITPAKHAKLGASGSHRWLYCPGSVKAQEAFPESTSFAADEGTAAHELAELVLTRGGNARDWIGKALIENNAFSVDEYMADYVQVYVDYVKGFSGRHEYEQRVSFGDWVPDGFGTADAVILDEGTLRVIDLKYGKGHLVEAHENSQGMLYALGALDDFSHLSRIERVVISIVQPRRDHIDEWEISVEELLKRGAWIRERAEAALAPDAPRVAGEKQCQWCTAKATCPALMRKTIEVIGADFDNLDEMDNPDQLSQAQQVKAFGAKKLIVSWLDALETHLFEQLERGEDVPGYKLVAGRASRSWADEAQAEKVLVTALGDKAYERSLLSVAKAEKLLTRKRTDLIEPLISKSQGKPTMVTQFDSRPSLSVTASAFDD